VVNPEPVFPSPKFQVNVSESPSGSDEPAALNVISSPDLTLESGVIEKVDVGALLPLKESKQPARGVLIINKTNKNASPRRRAIIRSVVSISHQSYGFP
jgi:hypothetical protein